MASLVNAIISFLGMASWSKNIFKENIINITLKKQIIARIE